MTDWSKLRDAYGPADDIPALLDRLVPAAEGAVWSDLWSRLCHQGTVYSASFAALPALARAARSWPPDRREAALALAGAIVASNDRFQLTTDPLREHASTIASLYSL